MLYFFLYLVDTSTRCLREFCSISVDICMDVWVCVCASSYLFILSQSRKIQVTGSEFQCHPADIFPGCHHRAIPHWPVASGLPWTLSFLYERQSHTGTSTGKTLSWICAWISVGHVISHNDRVATMEELLVLVICFSCSVFSFQNSFKQHLQFYST